MQRREGATPFGAESGTNTTVPSQNNQHDNTDDQQGNHDQGGDQQLLPPMNNQQQQHNLHDDRGSHSTVQGMNKTFAGLDV